MKKTIILILSVSILINIILGYGIYSTQNNAYTKVETANELSLYNCCSCLYFALDDLNNEIFLSENKNQINSEYMNQFISKNAERVFKIGQMILQLCFSDEHINNKINTKNGLMMTGNYFMLLVAVTSRNIPLDNEDISILHEILDKGKLFGLYGETSKNYKKELDPEHPPIDKIAELYEDMEKPCERGYEKLKAKMENQK